MTYGQDGSVTANDLYNYLNAKDKNEVIQSLKSKGFYKVEDGISLHEKYRKDIYPPYITEYGGECVILSDDHPFGTTKSVEYTSHEYMNTAAYSFRDGLVKMGFRVLTSGYGGKNNRFHAMLCYSDHYLVNIQWDDVNTSRGYKIDFPFIRIVKNDQSIDFSTWSFGKNENSESSSSSNNIATVTYRKSGCDYFVLENNSGFIVAEWMGGNDPDLGDKIAGDFKSYGTKEFYNNTRKRDCKFWIEDYALSKESAMKKISEHCR